MKKFIATLAKEHPIIVGVLMGLGILSIIGLIFA